MTQHNDANQASPDALAAASAPSAGSVWCIIPARLASTRLPGKPLLARTGKPLIQHVVEQVQLATKIDRIIVATDDSSIIDAVQKFGTEAMLTRQDHPNGTSRLAEVVQQLTDQGEPAPRMVVNVQGDEPLIEPEVIDQLIAGLDADPAAAMATLASPFAAHEDPRDPNIVKIVVDQRSRAIFFSRSLIPYPRQGDAEPLKHPGLYAYRPDFLLAYVTLPATPLEQVECLEQLRAIEHGHAIAVVHTQTAHHGIDTPAQYDAFVQYMLNKQGLIPDRDQFVDGSGV